MENEVPYGCRMLPSLRAPDRLNPFARANLDQNFFCGNAFQAGLLSEFQK